MCLLNLEDADVSNMLEANETNEGVISDQIIDQVEDNINKDDQDTVKEEIEPVSVMHTSPAQQSPQRTVATPQSAALSPRVAGRPSKGNMVARNIVMEQEELAKPTPVESNSQQLVGDAETLSREDLENASIVFMQDGMLVHEGVVMQSELVMNLNESGQTTSIVNDIQVVQDASHKGVVVVPHEDVSHENDKEVDVNETTKPSDRVVSESADAEKERCVTPKLGNQLVENKSPSRTPLKSSEISPVKKIADEAQVNTEPPVPKPLQPPADEFEKSDTSKLEEVSKTAVLSITEDAIEKVAEFKEAESSKKIGPLSPREKLPKPKPASPSKRDKSPVISESSNEMGSEDDITKEDALDKSKKESDLKVQAKEIEEDKKTITTREEMEDGNVR